MSSRCSRDRPLRLGLVAAAQRKTDEDAETIKARKRLQGRWTLMSLELFPPNQPALQVDASGSLEFDASARA